MRLLDAFSRAGAVRLIGVLVVAVALATCCVGVSSASAAAAVVKTISVGAEPEAVSSDGTHVWVANSGSGTVSEIDASTGTVVNTIKVDDGPLIAPLGVSSDGTHVWVTNYNSGNNTDGVIEIDPSTGTVIQTIPLGSNIYAGGVSSDGTHVWVTYLSGASLVSEIDASTGTVVNTITIGNGSEGSIAVSSDGTDVWVANVGGTVSEIDASTGTVVNTIPVGSDPVAVSSDGTHVWVANSGCEAFADCNFGVDGTVSEIDASTGTVVNTIPVGSDPVAVSSDGTHVWVTGYNSDDDGMVSEIDASTGTVVNTIPVGSSAPPGDVFWAGVSSDGTHVWGTNSGDDTVSEIQIAPVPTVTNLSVRSGSIAGGTPVVVTGSGFGNPGDADTVTFVPEGGGAPIHVVNPVVVSETEIDLTTPDVSAFYSGGVFHTNVQVTTDEASTSTIGLSGQFNFPATVVEMGDSIAAGEGTLDGFFYSPANGETGLWSGGVANAPGFGPYPECHDSGYAYGQLLSAALRTNFVTLACTGASYAEGIIGPERVENSFGIVTETVPAQFPSAAYDAAEPDAVVMTYGADDVKFSSIAEECILSALASSPRTKGFLIGAALGSGNPEVAELLKLALEGPEQCTESTPGSTVNADFWTYLPKLEESYEKIVSAIESGGRDASPARVPKIIFTNYMDPFPPNGIGCADTWPLDNAQLSYFNILFTKLNSKIEAAAKGLHNPNVRFVDISKALDGHTWCTSEPWDYGLSVIFSSGQLLNFLSRETISKAPFHPTPAGQAAIAKLVRPVVAEALGLNETAAAVTAASTDGGGSANGVTVEPGESISTQASGFAPGETVEEALHSTPVSLGSVMANGNGEISATVTVPLGTPAGQHELLFTGQTSGVTATLPVLIPAPPAGPVFTTDSPPQTVPSGGVYAGDFGASGVPAPAYALAPGAPAWLGIEPSFTGIVSGTPPSDTTSFTYSVIASNGVGPVATAGPFTVTVTAGSESLAGSGLTRVLGAKEETKAPATGSTSLDGSTISVQRNHEALIKLTCTGTATCSGRLTIMVKRTTGKGKKRHTKTQTIGTATFSIAAGKSETVKLTLNGTGRALLNAAHGRLSATLAILKSSPSPSKTQTENVHLAQQKAKKSMK